MKPLLLVDVDGVLNCFGSIWTDTYEAEHFVRDLPLAYDRYTIRCRLDTADRLRELLHHFEPVWATAWTENAHPYWRHVLGLDEEPWPHIDFGPGWAPLGGTWKLPTVRQWAEEGPGAGRALAWIDDDLQPDAYEWAHNRIAAGIPTLLIKTKPHEGLGEREETRLKAFAGACSELAR